MKTFFLAFSLLIFINYSSANNQQTGTVGDTSLQGRLSEFLKANDEMNIESLAEYVYPKLFTIASKADLIKALKEGFDSEELSVELDSLQVKKIYPVFRIKEGQFAKVNYSMLMLMKFKLEKDSTNDNNVLLENIVESMAEEFGAANLSLDKTTGTIKIKKLNIMVAVKDEYAKEWSFVELKEKDPMMNKLFTKEVLAKLATYK